MGRDNKLSICSVYIVMVLTVWLTDVGIEGREVGVLEKHETLSSGFGSANGFTKSFNTIYDTSRYGIFQLNNGLALTPQMGYCFFCSLSLFLYLFFCLLLTKVRTWIWILDSFHVLAVLFSYLFLLIFFLFSTPEFRGLSLSNAWVYQQWRKKTNFNGEKYKNKLFCERLRRRNSEIFVFNCFKNK